MNPERWQQVRSVLEHAIALAPDKQSSYIEEECCGDPELRDEVSSLLHSHQQAGNIFLSKPVVDLKSSAATATPSRIGRRVGAYQIVEEIAHGGMGEVYRATRVDGEYDKHVAIKLLRLGFDTPELLKRFRHERQILATLEHPNIARLLDAGSTDDGIPYLLMELIDGSPIDRYCDDKGLVLADRLQLFREVCLAVQYAHQRLVIHRDIKPSNILVTGDGIPKLLDFGIAKIVDPAAGTEATVLRPMTPEYASPEQVRGDSITTATDVYSLGVVLYRLLAGRSPYPEKTRLPLEFAEVICEFEPRPPSIAALTAPALPQESRRSSSNPVPHAFHRALQGDLDNIVSKALRKEPERRYATVEQMAEDIRRHLDGLPVLATPDSAAYRLGKFVRRHKSGVAASALLVLAIAGGVATTLREARLALRERARAERRFNDVRKLANSFLFEFDEAIKNLPGSTPARSLVVKRALEYLDGLAAEAREDRSLQMEIAAAYQKVAEVQGDPMFPNLGNSNGALESSRKALAILESLSQAEPENHQFRLALASTHQEMSDVLAFSGDTAGAVEHSGKALNLYEALAAKSASDPKFQSERVIQTYHYANLLKLAGNLDEAAEQYGHAVELSQKMVAERPSDQEGKIHLSTSLDGLGNVLQEKGDTAGALENRRRGLAIREELTRLDPNNAHYRRQLAFSHHNVGLSLIEAGDLASALTNFRQELSLFETLSTADPKDVQGRRNRSLAHKQIGDVLMRSEEVRAALAQYRSALEIDRDLAAGDPHNSQAELDLSFSESKVGSALGTLGQAQQGLVMLQTAVTRQESLIAKDPHHILLHNHLANSYTLLAKVLLKRNRMAAIGYFRKAVAARLTLSEKSPNSVTNRGALAQCYANLAEALGAVDREGALKEFSTAVELLEHLTSLDRSNVQFRVTFADTLSKMAQTYMRAAEDGKETPTRNQYWTKARSLYQRSQEAWIELEKAGKLPPAHRGEVRGISAEIARCDESLASLERVSTH